ncbi:Ankyrin-1 [Araneus ventricosus]|uniref:Ankyrin-1 n=1 Tax=Araneus ventricosus TaxID=182803 RepID=A0A4Y2TEP8_ARAVE|nr:Ankyrin-1 [Araneus ventricosus]
MYRGEDNYEDEINIDLMKIKLLLEENADVNIRDEYEVTPLCRVMRSERFDIIKLFSESATELKNIKDRYGITPLYYAVKYGLYDVIELFLTKGADVNARNEDNETALSCAIRLGDSDLVKLFLECGADMNAKYKNDNTILHLACDGDDHLDIIKILLRKGSDVHARNEFDQVPLHAAVYRNHVFYIQLLLERGASVHVADINGWTPIHAAAYKGHVEVIRALLDEGADVNSKNKEGKTPLDLATENKNQLCIDALQKLIIDYSCQIYLGIVTSRFEATRGIFWSRSRNLGSWRDDEKERHMRHTHTHSTLLSKYPHHRRGRLTLYVHQGHLQRSIFGGIGFLILVIMTLVGEFALAVLFNPLRGGVSKRRLGSLLGGVGCFLPHPHTQLIGAHHYLRRGNG